MTAPRLVVDRAGVARGLLEAGADLAALLRSLPDGAADRPVPGLDWTVGETAAHAVTVVRRSLGDRRRSTSPADTHVLNATCLDELAERRPDRLADLLAAEVPVVVGEVLPRFPDDDLPVAFHGGTTTRLLTAYGIMLFDLLVHRRDIARAVGRDVRLPPGPAVLALQALLELLPVWLDRRAAGPDGPELDVVLRVTGDRAYRLVVASGTLTVGPADGTEPADRVLRVDPEKLLLVLCRRVTPGDPRLAVLQGLLEPM